MEIVKQMREIERQGGSDEVEKKTLIKKMLEKYLIDYEMHCFEEAWKELNQPLNNMIKTIIRGLEETFSKKIGVLPFEWRRVKLLKYLEKK